MTTLDFFVGNLEVEGKIMGIPYVGNLVSAFAVVVIVKVSVVAGA